MSRTDPTESQPLHGAAFYELLAKVMPDWEPDAETGTDDGLRKILRVLFIKSAQPSGSDSVATREARIAPDRILRTGRLRITKTTGEVAYRSRDELPPVELQCEESSLHRHIDQRVAHLSGCCQQPIARVPRRPEGPKY